MKKVLVTGAGSYVGESVRAYVKKTAGDQIVMDAVDTFDNHWKSADFSEYDVVFHVAGIAHVNAKKSMEPLYYKVNRDLTIEIGKWAKEHGVKQFIFMSSQIVYHESQSLKADIVNKDTEPNPNGFYGDSKLQAENGLHELECETFKVCILRPPMIFGVGCKGNFLRLGWLATKTPIFPAWHNERSILHVDNLAEFVKQLILRDMSGTFYPQNKDFFDTVEIVRYFAKKYNHKIWISKVFNPFVWLGSFFLQPLNKMFATYYYEHSMSEHDFDYEVVSLEEALTQLEITEANRKMK